MISDSIQNTLVVHKILRQLSYKTNRNRKKCYVHIHAYITLNAAIFLEKLKNIYFIEQHTAGVKNKKKKKTYLS